MEVGPTVGDRATRLVRRALAIGRIRGLSAARSAPYTAAVLGEPVRGGFPDRAIYSLSGIEQLRAFLDGLALQPPLVRLTGATLTQVGSGTASVSMPASPWLMQIDAMEVTMLAVHTLISAVRTGIPPATEINLATFSIHHLRAALPESGGMIGRGRVIHTGRGVTVAEVLVEDGAGRGVAHGTGSLTTEPMTDPPPERVLRPVEEPRYATPDPYLRPVPEPISMTLIEQMTGLELIRRCVDRQLVLPVGELLAIRFPDCGDGHCSCSLPTSDWLCLEHGRIAPSVLMAVASFSLHGATQTVSARAQRLSPIHQTVEFLRPVPVDGRDIMARGQVTDWDGRMAIAKTELLDADGNIVVRGQQSALTAPGRRHHRVVETDRVLATVLFTDIAQSTRLAESLGDHAWQQLLGEHHDIVRRQLQTFKGREIKTTGDGFLALFDSPTRAVQCARAIRDGLKRLNLEVRAGVHTGECDVSGADVSGIAIHVASRVQSAAEPGDILVSHTVRDLVAGSGLHLTDRGPYELKGLDGTWRLFGAGT
jgi:class 3 adenylate cyclase